MIKSLQTDFNILVLTRGFNRISKLDLSSKKQALTVENFGDEPVMISNYLSNGEIIVSKNRTNFLIQNQDSYKGFIVILDDGYQHYRLERDLDILIVDDETSKSNRTLPVGKLREKPEEIIRANVVLYNSINSYNYARQFASPEAKFFDVKFLIDSIYNYKNEVVLLDNKYKNLLVTGIANPHRVLNSLKEFGVNINEFIEFNDHHNYTENDVQNLLKKNFDFILTTEKDFVKLKEFDSIINRLLFIKMKTIINDEIKLLEFVKKKINDKQLK